MLTDPNGRTAGLWAAEIEEDGYRALTRDLALPQVVSPVAEPPPRTIVRITGRGPADATGREVVRMLCTEPED